MRVTARQILNTYLTLTVLSTFSFSFIWGINTLFLLDAGLSITEAFAANAFFTVGQVLFEVPTGVVADAFGRRVSYLLGALTLFVSTALYLLLWEIEGPFWAWAITSIALGLGFTFFSGATEAWLVDALKFADYRGTLDAAFAKGQIAGGIAMLIGTVSGGVVAQLTHLGVPYLLRALMLGLTFLVAYALMHDYGFTRRSGASVSGEVRGVFSSSLTHGFRNPPVRWLMLAELFVAGVGYYAFYAMQPYLLALYGREESYAIAGLAAAIFAGAQIVGGFLVPYVRRAFGRRTTLVFFTYLTGAGALALIGFTSVFWIALVLLTLWAVVDAISYPVRQAFINGLIPSVERATVLSFDNLLSSSGGVVLQPALGRAADVWSYAISYVLGAGVSLLALPFVLLARREHAVSDATSGEGK
ncbi:MFS transporter [Thiohalomonas denitrificans]|uniref:MFS transporter n=1 Tax=Thiohalomonas denitrificans TaxID=415747 RepID=UPI0026F1E7E8|nr:MFS transporter [Thiohalomonas denitrificans]